MYDEKVKIIKSSKHKRKKKDLTNLEILLIKPKFRIYSYLEMYGKLSSQKLEKLIGKSKSTVNIHLQDLQERGIIAEPTTRDIKGNFIYQLSDDYEEKIRDFEDSIDITQELSERDLIDIINIEGKGAQINQNNLQILVDFAKKIKNDSESGLSENQISELREMVQVLRDKSGKLVYDDQGNLQSQYEILNSFQYLTRDEYMIFRQEWRGFLEHVKKKTANLKEQNLISDQDKGKTMYIATFGIPIKRMLKLLDIS
jgi:DNA-binding transcriptional ArsR family regulator